MLIHDLLSGALGHLQEYAGSTFHVDGVATTFTGVFNRHQFASALTVGGYDEDVDATISATKAQFTGLWIPDRGKRLFCQSKAFQIVGVTEDAWSFTLSLKGVNQ